MKRFEIKKALFIGLLILTIIGTDRVFADEYTSINFEVTNPIISKGQSNSSSTNFGLGQSVGQAGIGQSSSTNFQLWSGFQYFFNVSQNTLTATPGATQVLLNWTVPDTFLGINVTSYEVGVGTVSGSYVFTDVGNITNHTVTGLTNGVPYFFIIKAKAIGGLFLTFSNEATATPTTPVTPPPSGGGGPGITPPPPPPSGTASIVLSGLAYPGRTVTILRDGVIAAGTIADPGAAFNVTLSGLGAGTYNISLYAIDEIGRESARIAFAQTLTDNVTITVGNLYLAPTIGVSHQVIKQGENISIFGFTTPSSDVTIVVNSEVQFVEQVRSGATGAYFKAFGTAVLEIGDHSTRSQAAVQNLVSGTSLAANFRVGDETVENPQLECRRSDLNCDGRVNLTDFSILLFYWNHSNPANPRADINKSGSVDLTDFSILLYDWTG